MKIRLMQHLAKHFPNNTPQTLKQLTNNIAERGKLNLSRQKINVQDFEQALSPIINHFDISNIELRGINFEGCHSKTALQEFINILSSYNVRNLEKFTFAGQSQKGKINLEQQISQLFASNPRLSHLNLDYNGQSETSIAKIIARVSKTQISHLSIKDSTDSMKFLSMTEDLCPNVVTFNGVDTIHIIEARELLSRLKKVGAKENDLIDFALDNPKLLLMKNAIKHLIEKEHSGKERVKLSSQLSKAECYLKTQLFLNQSYCETLESVITIQDLAEIRVNSTEIDIFKLIERNPENLQENLRKRVKYLVSNSSHEQCLDHGLSFVKKLQNQERRENCPEIG